MVKALRHHSRAAHLAKQQHVDLKFAAFVFDLQTVARMDLARRLDNLPVGLNPAELARPPRHRTRFKESGRPQPFVDPHARHQPILVPLFDCALASIAGRGSAHDVASGGGPTDQVGEGTSRRYIIAN